MNALMALDGVDEIEQLSSDDEDIAATGDE